MSRWRPSPAEERWLAVASELGPELPSDALRERTGAWRSAGVLARSALFVLGLAAAVLLLAILGFGNGTLLVTGLITVFAAEWLTVRKRLHASGIEEGLCVAGYLMVGGWSITRLEPWPDSAERTADILVLIAATGAAGLRLLNPLLTTSAAIAFVFWVDSTATAQALDEALGFEWTALAVGCALAALALALGVREYRRPSHDRMLDWLVASLPAAAYAQRTDWDLYAASPVMGDAAGGRLAVGVVLLALGAAMLVVGLRRRRHAPLLGFMGCMACVAVEVRLATRLSTETWLILYGVAALAAGMALDRYLRRPRNGLTSASLTPQPGTLDLLQTAGAALLAHRAAPEAPRQEPGYAPGGGRFGGGGADGSY